MKILHLINSLPVAALLFAASVTQAQTYTNVYGGYNYQGNLKVRDTTFVKRLIAGDCALDSSALAEFNSTCKGILVPRLTTTQMDSIRNPANGLLVYDITVGCFFYYDDSTWVGMGACASPWSTAGGNVIIDDSTQKVGIGTANPTATLQVGDSANPGTIKYVDGNQAAGKTLTSDAAGNASWQTPVTGWGLSGNTGTTSATNYIGTSDNNGVAFKTNNIAFGYIDSLQRFNFSTLLDSDIYGVSTSNNLGGIGLNGIFIGDQTSYTGLYEIDARLSGLSKHMVLVGDTSQTHIIVSDSILLLQSDSLLYLQSAYQASLQAPNGVFIGSNAGVAVNGTVVAIFGQNPSYYTNNISDSSQVGGEFMVGWNYIGGNTLSGGMGLGTNIILGDQASMTGNNLVGHGVIDGTYPGMSENFITGNSHIDSNYIEGDVLLWNLGRGADNSSWSNNYLKNLSTEVNLQDVSGQFNEYVVHDSITGDYSGISNITLLGADSIAYNTLSGPSTSIRNLVMQNSNVNYCNLAIPNAGVISSQFYNSNITGVTNQVYNSTFFNVSKNFLSDSTPWNNVMLINDNVGIGIISKPTATLQIGDSSNNQSFRYVDGNQGYGKVLTSDATGNATWQSSTGGGGGNWGLYGNSGTNMITNYIGTTDYNGLTFKTNNVTFGSVDQQQHFSFSTTMDSAVYGVQTTNDIAGAGANGFFAGNETAQAGFYEFDGTPFGAPGPFILAGTPGGSHLTIQDSLIQVQSAGNIALNGQQSVSLNTNGNSVMVNSQQISANAPFVTAFNPTILPDSIADSSTVNSNIITGGATYGNNTLSGGMMVSENYISDGGSSCVGNTLVGHGLIDGWKSGIASNYLHVASHLDSNYLEGAVLMQDLGKHSHSSNFSHNYLKSLTTPAQIFGISGESVENVTWDSISGGNGIFNLTLMSFDSVAYNVLSGANTNINNLVMQNSDLNYCHFLSPNKGIGFSQFFNSRIINDTVSILNCLFHNITKDFGSETQLWTNVVLLNDYVGIGITSKPTASFQIGDSFQHQTFRYVDGNEGSGKVLTSDASGNASWRAVSITGLADSTSYFTPGATVAIAPGDSIILSDTVAVAPYKYNIIDSTGALSNLTISLPSSPVEGEWVEVKLAQSGVLVHYLNGTVANSAPTYIQPSNLYIRLVFRASKNIWY
jgi:hypothetical protein